MKITEVRVKLVANKDDRLKAFCSITIDREFVVRDIKIIEGPASHFAAMPSRRMTDHCAKCGAKNHLKARFCNNCGGSLPGSRTQKKFKGRFKLYVDIAHPINTECRKRIQARIIAAFEEEVEKSKLPGYKPVEVEITEEDIPQVV